MQRFVLLCKKYAGNFLVGFCIAQKHKINGGGEQASWQQ